MTETPGLTSEWSGPDTVIYHGQDAIATVWLGYERYVPMFKAAPDLLAACEAVAGVFEGIEDVPMFALKCREAIAKARAL